MVYRKPSDAEEPPDQEALAIAELGRRAQRLRSIIVVPLILLGVAAGFYTYGELRDWQLDARGAHMPGLTAVASFVPTFGASLWLSPRVANALAARVIPRWRAAIARKYGLDARVFEEMTKFV